MQRIAVVGGGPAGVELALALASRFAGQLRLVLVCATPEPIADGARRGTPRGRAHALVDAGVELVCGVTATALDDGPAAAVGRQLYGGRPPPCGPPASRDPPCSPASGVACDRTGCIRVTRELRSVSHPHVFAAGDCAALEGDPRPKAGVWAVRAGAPLAENLRRAATRRTLQAMAPAARGTGDPRPRARPGRRLA